MLTIAKITTSTDAVHYYAEYAQEKGEGEGAFLDFSRSLGVDGNSVSLAEMENLLRGFSPDGKQALCRGSGDGHHPGWDLTFSAPKSVSIAWANAAPDSRAAIEAAHERALTTALQFLNNKAGYVRVGRGGAEAVSADLVLGLFQHSSNRAEEPHLHTHAILFNVARTSRDGQWRTLQPRPIYRAYMAAGALYKAELALGLQRLGFAVERTAKAGFRLQGVPLEVCLAQSSRSQEVEALLAEQGLDRDSAPARLKEAMTLKSRAGKGHERIARDFERWQAENASAGFGPEDQERLLKDAKDRTSTLRGRDQRQLVAATLDELTARTSTFSTYDLHRRLAEASLGRQGASGVFEAVKVAETSRNVLRMGPNALFEERFSTREMYLIERETMDLVKSRQGEGTHVVDRATVDAAIVARPTIKPEQERALRHITLGKDAVTFIEGDAGTGKSFLMSAVREIYEEHGYSVHGLSFTNKAAQGLKIASGIDSRSVDRFLLDHQNGRSGLTSRSVVILDEAAMLDSRKTRDLIRIASDAGAKLVMVGDEKQIQPISAGQAFGTLLRTFGSERLSEIVRQKASWEREAIKDLGEGRTEKALAAFDQDDRRQLHILSDRNAARAAMIDEWSAAACVRLDAAPLMVATTNVEVTTLNLRARERLVDFGLINRGVEIKTAHGTAPFAAGDQIVFTGNYKKKNIFNSTLARIEKVNPATSGITAVTETGRRVRFSPKTMDQFRHGYAITAHKSQGSTVSRVLVLFDGYGMDREKLYVAMSRGREKSTLFADKASVGDLSFTERNSMRELPETERGDFERRVLRKNLAHMVGLSHKKDTTHDYRRAQNAFSLGQDLARPARKLGEWLDQVKTDLNRRWEQLKESASWFFGPSKHEAAAAQHEAAKLKGRETERILEHEIERD